jgi:hypothetical protein
VRWNRWAASFVDRAAESLRLLVLLLFAASYPFFYYSTLVNYL